jgi:putative membrane protein
MKTVFRILLKWLACVGALYLAWQVFPDQVACDIPGLLATGTLLWLVNMFIRPIIKILSLPITILTLGLFGLVINALMVKLAAWMVTAVMVPGMVISGIWICIFISVIISIINTFVIKKL